MYFLTEVELSVNYLPCHRWRKPAVMGEAEKLRLLVGREDDDSVKMLPAPRFIEQGNIDEQPCMACTRLGGLGGPAGADNGMQDMFKSLPFFVASKDQLPELCTVRVAGVIARFEPECIDD